ncbi:protein of unknown function [Rhodovastum atsumiense]|nr:protein of unknown function [Rhodovastum atsumiense]
MCVTARLTLQHSKGNLANIIEFF